MDDATQKLGICPTCRHAEHEGYTCLNMASDSDCGCDKRPPKVDADATQKLVDEARARAEQRWPIPANYLPGDPERTLLEAQRHAYVLGRLDEAAQRPPVSPEAREAIQALRAIEEADRVDHRGHVGDDGEPCGMGRTWMTRMGRDLAAALDHLDTALRGGELTREETNG